MFDKIIQFSLKYRLMVLAMAVFLFVYGVQVFQTLGIDVFPDLNRPTVTIITEAEGLAPEEVETLVTFPIESVMNGSSGVKRVRSSSSIGFSIVYVEFDWDTNIYLARQIISEKLNQVTGQLPEGVHSVLGPVSSVMGEILFLGVTSENSDISPMDLRTLADWNIRQRLLGVSGVSQITVMGGEVKQYQVLIDPDKLLTYGVTLHDVREALSNTNVNTTGGFYLDQYKESMIRNLGRVQSIDDLKKAVLPVTVDPSSPAITIEQIAEVKLGSPIAKRGDASINGVPGVLMAVSKQPGTDTIDLTERIDEELEKIRQTLPDGVFINEKIFRQSTFIERSIHNIVEALRDGSILVAVVLFLFLMNLRTTAITLVVIPLSFIVTFIIFKWFGLTINTMTLGGLAVAIGELVDDAIVNVENVFRRLKENAKAEHKQSSFSVVLKASTEVRGSIIFSTVIVVLVFLPLFSMSGMEGKIFAPLGVAYIVSIMASTLVALTVTPALCSYLLPSMLQAKEHVDGVIVRTLKKVHQKSLEISMKCWSLVLMLVIGVFIVAMASTPFLGREFLPEFNEGSFVINLVMAPGTNLEESNRISIIGEKLLHEIPEVTHTGRRSGRAEEDEHALGVNTSEIEVNLKESDRSKAEIVKDIRTQLAKIPGIVINIGQPISHRLEMITSGINAQIAIKIFGDDLTTLRTKAGEVQELINNVEGLTDLQMEQQLLIPQFHVRLDREKARQHGVMIGEAARHAQLALQGETVSTVLDNGRMFDIVMRLNDKSRLSKDDIEKIPFETVRETIVPLGFVADVEEAKGPNMINRESVHRRIVVQANVKERDVVSVVNDIKKVLKDNLELPEGYFIQYDGQFQAQASAQKTILILSILSFVGMFLALYMHFRSVNLSLQVMLTIPLALIGSIAGLWLTNGVFSIATLVGFITLVGIASRNGIMLLSHYLHIMKHEDEDFDLKMLYRGTSERLVPVLMTALTALLALTPLLLAAGEAGKEILYPVALVIFSGLFSSTFLSLIVNPIIFWKFSRKTVINLLHTEKE